LLVSVYFVVTQSGNFWIHPRILAVLEVGLLTGISKCLLRLY